MKKTVQAWIKGWGVIIRLWVFLFIAALPMYPLHIITNRVQRTSANSTFPTGELLAVLILVLVLPFAFYLASRTTGEFLIPKRVLNQMMTRDSFRRGLNATFSSGTEKEAER